MQVIGGIEQKTSENLPSTLDPTHAIEEEKLVKNILKLSSMH